MTLLFILGIFTGIILFIIIGSVVELNIKRNYIRSEQTYRTKINIISNLMKILNREVKPFTLELYTSFYFHPRLVDANGNDVKISFIDLTIESIVRKIYFKNVKNDEFVHPEHVYIVIPIENELRTYKEKHNIKDETEEKEYHGEFEELIEKETENSLVSNDDVDDEVSDDNLKM